MPSDSVLSQCGRENFKAAKALRQWPGYYWLFLAKLTVRTTSKEKTKQKDLENL
jgi:hypothetical protein